MNRMKGIITFFLIFISFPLSAKISERELKHYSSHFLSRVIEDNREYERNIIECLSGVVKDNGAGMRLMDKFGLFLYESRKQGVVITKTRFFYHEHRFSLFIVFEDDYDGQLYTLYLEYAYNRKKRTCSLKDVYFSLVFDEEMKRIERFFKRR
jgi:hypothetical protein